MESPAVVDGNDAAPVDGDGLPGWLRHVEVLPRRVAPPAVVAGKVVVGRAVVGGGDGDLRPLLAPRRLPRVAHDLEARAAGGAVVEQRRAQCRVLDAVPVAVQVLIPTRATCIHGTPTLERRPNSQASNVVCESPTHSAGSITPSIEGCRGRNPISSQSSELRGKPREEQQQ